MKKLPLIIGPSITLVLILVIVSGLIGDFGKGLFAALFVLTTYQIIRSNNSHDVVSQIGNNDFLRKPSILNTAVLLAGAYAISLILYLVIALIIQYNPCNSHSWGYSERVCASSVIERRFSLSN